MFLRFSFSILLTAIFLALTGTQIEAAPVRRTRMVTLPLKRVQARSDVHPQILLQQHINRSQKRLARMTGRTEPSEHQLRRNIEKRMFLLPSGPAPSSADIQLAEKRFNESGTHRKVGKRFNQAGTHRNGKRRGGDDTNDNSNDGGQGGRGNGRNGGNNNNNNNNDDVVTVTVTEVAGEATATAAATTATAKATAEANANAAESAATNTTASATKGAAAGATETAAAAAAAGANPGVTDIEIDALVNGGSTAPEAPTADNSEGLEIFANDVGYFAAVQIGTPPREFKILMDSGSADFWVGAEGCQSEIGGNCGDHVFLGADSSSSFVDLGEDFQVTYGTGAVAGSKITDDITVAGLTLKAHSFGVAELETLEFADDSVEFDGLLGTAQSILANQAVLTPVEAMKEQGLITSSITAYELGRLADGKNEGQITFGGLDETRFDAASQVTLDNVSQVGFWEATMDSVSVDGTDIGLDARKAILDTGTTLILAPLADATALHAGIEGAQSDGQGGFIVPCTTTAIIELAFGGKQFKIDPRDLAFAPVDINDPTGDCISGISAGNIGDADEWLVGDTFLKSVYFSHDVDTNTMTLANLK